MCKMVKKQTNANKRIAAIMKIRNNDSAISFAANYSIYLFHFIYNIYFAYG